MFQIVTNTLCIRAIFPNIPHTRLTTQNTPQPGKTPLFKHATQNRHYSRHTDPLNLCQETPHPHTNLAYKPCRDLGFPYNAHRSRVVVVAGSDSDLNYSPCCEIISAYNPDQQPIRYASVHVAKLFKRLSVGGRTL